MFYTLIRTAHSTIKNIKWRKLTKPKATPPAKTKNAGTTQKRRMLFKKLIREHPEPLKKRSTKKLFI